MLWKVTRPDPSNFMADPGCGEHHDVGAIQRCHVPNSEVSTVNTRSISGLCKMGYDKVRTDKAKRARR